MITGVLGGRLVAPEPIAQELGKLTANLGVFAVLGNHDRWYGADRVHQSLLSVGISVLEDDSVHTHFNKNDRPSSRMIPFTLISTRMTGHRSVD